MATTHWATGGALSVDLENISSSANGAKFRLGTHVTGNNSSEWLYVYASAAIAQYATVGVRASGTATSLIAANARLGHVLGVAQQAFAAGDYGFIATKGQSLRVLTSGAIAVGARLYTSATAGRVQATAASTEAQLTGLTLIATASGTTASSAAAVSRGMIVIDPAFLI